MPFWSAGDRDYQLLRDNIIFQVGDSEQMIEISISRDNLVEKTETFVVRISILEQPFPVEIGIEEATVLIEDIDG